MDQERFLKIELNKINYKIICLDLAGCNSTELEHYQITLVNQIVSINRKLLQYCPALNLPAGVKIK